MRSFHWSTESVQHFKPQNVLSKLYHYGVKGAVHQWFKNYLTGSQQYTTTQAQQTTQTKSSLSSIIYGVPQGSVLGSLLFLPCIYDLNKAVVHSKVHHFTDDTNFLHASHSLKHLNKTINFDILT